MTSDKELAANRANAQHSTGPTSPEGKATSSQNSLKHGLTGKTILLPGENPTEFELFCTAIVADLEPAGPLEREFAQIVAHSQWRLKRIKRIEDGLLAYGQFGPTDPFSDPACFMDNEVLARSFMDNRKSFNNLSQYESRIYRTMADALKQIKGLQTSRNKFEEDVQGKASFLFHERWYTSGMPQPVSLPVPESEPPAVEVIPVAVIENLPDNDARETVQVCASEVLSPEEPVQSETADQSTGALATPPLVPGRSEITNGEVLSPLRPDRSPNTLVVGFVFPIDKFAEENHPFQPVRDEKTEAAPAEIIGPRQEAALSEVA